VSDGHTIRLNKGSHRYVFRYLPGQEECLIDGMARMALDSRHVFDYYDAAVMSFQIGKIREAVEQ